MPGRDACTVIAAVSASRLANGGVHRRVAITAFASLRRRATAVDAVPATFRYTFDVPRVIIQLVTLLASADIRRHAVAI